MGPLGTHPALARYLSEPDGADRTAAGIHVLTVAGERVHTVTRFHGDALFAPVGLPTVLG